MCGAELHPAHRTLTLAVESSLVVVAVAALLMALWVLRPQNIEVPSTAALPTAVPTSTRIPTRGPTFTPISTASATSTAVPGGPALLTYTVKAGDTLSGIATRFETTVASIVAASGLKNDKVTLQIGQTLKIPQSLETAGPGPAADAQASAESGLAIAQPTATAPAVVPTVGVAPDAVTHTVKRGEFLEVIAKKYGVSIDQIVQANGFKDANQLLRIGQVLVIRPGSAPASDPTVMPTEGSPPLAPTPSPIPRTTVWATYTPMPTREFSYPAPVSLGPPDGHQFGKEDTSVLLNWTSVGILRDDEWYVVRVRIVRGGEMKEATGWVKSTSWRLPDSLRPTVAGEVFRYEWDVAVQRQTGTGAGDTPGGVPTSPRSITHQFTWSP